MVNKTAFWGGDRLPQKCEMCRMAAGKQGAMNVGQAWRAGEGLLWEGCWNQKVKNESIGRGTEAPRLRGRKGAGFDPGTRGGTVVVSEKKSDILPASIWRCYWKKGFCWSFISPSLESFIWSVTKFSSIHQAFLVCCLLSTLLSTLGTQMVHALRELGDETVETIQ